MGGFNRLWGGLRPELESWIWGIVGVFPGPSSKTVPRYFQWERGGLDAHGMMTGDDTGGDVWTVAGAW